MLLISVREDRDWYSRDPHFYLSYLLSLKTFSTALLALAFLELSGVNDLPGIALIAPVVSVTGSSFFFGNISFALMMYLSNFY